MSSDLRARLPMTLFFSDVKQSGVQTAVALSERIEILLSSCNLKVFKFQFYKFYRNSICEKMEKKLAVPLESTAQSWHLNGHTLGFHPQTQKLEPPCTA